MTRMFVVALLSAIVAAAAIAATALAVDDGPGQINTGAPRLTAAAVTSAAPVARQLSGGLRAVGQVHARRDAGGQALTR